MSRMRVFDLETSDLAYGHMADKAVKVLSKWNEDNSKFLTLDDQIELEQCYALLQKGIPKPEYEQEHKKWLTAAEQAKNAAFQSVVKKLSLGLESIDEIVNIYFKYRDAFWRLVSRCGWTKYFSDEEIRIILEKNPVHLSSIMQVKQLVQQFDKPIKQHILSHKIQAVELIVDSIGLTYAGRSRNGIFLPSSLTKNDYDSIFISYIDEAEPNINILRAIVEWRGSWDEGIHISSEVKSKAKKKYKQANEDLLDSKNTAVIDHSFECKVNFEQKEILHIDKVGLNSKISLGTGWFEQFEDYPTLLNNCSSIFGFINSAGMLTAVPHVGNQHSVLFSLMAHSRDSFFKGPEMQVSDQSNLVLFMSYRSILQSIKIPMESLIEWFFKTYIKENYQISDLNVSLPTGKISEYQKCVLACAALEGIFRGYSEFVLHKQIDEDELYYSKDIRVPKIPSLVGDKYIKVKSPQVRNEMELLFSSQSPLAYASQVDYQETSFFDLITKHKVTAADFADYCNPHFEILLKDGIVERDSNEYLKITYKTLLMKQLREQQSLVYSRLESHLEKEASDMLKSGELVSYSALFSDDEADYFDFCLNNSKFSDALALRNLYLHGRLVAREADEKLNANNYNRLLFLILSTTLKINDDLYLNHPFPMEYQAEVWPYASENLKTGD